MSTFSQISAFIAHPRNSYLLSRVSKVSEVIVITVFDIVSLGLIDLTVIGNDSYPFCQFQNKV